MKPTALFVCVVVVLSIGVYSCGSPTSNSDLKIGGLTTTMVVGDVVQLTATSTGSGGQKDVTADTSWESSDPAVATISESGVLTIVKPGSTDIRASVRFGNATVHLVVHPVTGLAITRVHNPMAIGDRQQLRATANLPAGIRDVTARVQWRSGDDAVFTVTSDGLLTAAGLGLTDVRATFQSFTASDTGVVDQPGCTYQLASVAADFDRNAQNGSVRVTTQPGCEWSLSSDADWIITSPLPRSGTGNAVFSLPFLDGPVDVAARVGNLQVRWDTPTAGQNARIAQRGTCSASLSFPSAPVSADGGTVRGNIFLSGGGILSQKTVLLHSTADWIIVAFPTPDRWFQANDGFDVRLTILPNPDSTPRAGSVLICGNPANTMITQLGR